MTTATRPRRFQPGSPGYAKATRAIIRQVHQAEAALSVPPAKRKPEAQPSASRSRQQRPTRKTA